jgi:hypothetical protein
MQPPTHYRDRATALRRLLETITNLQVSEQLELAASDYDKLADELERAPAKGLSRCPRTS